MAKIRELLGEATPQGKRSLVTSRNKSSPSLSDLDVPVEYVISNYQGTVKYSLNHINSIFFQDGKIYNLLEKTSPKRIIKCGCVKSSCEAKYCQCFRAGEACGEECGCIGCKNRKARKSIGKTSQEIGCNCVKSGCLKKYCECFQNGKKCSEKCRCCDCRNLEDYQLG